MAEDLMAKRMIGEKTMERLSRVSFWWIFKFTF
jgi:hypothetical protein